MPSSSVPLKFSCDACQRTYGWKPELAGKRVKCKCGVALSVPLPAVEPELDAEEGSDLDGLYALAADANNAVATQSTSSSALRCPSCGKTMQPGGVICIECGHDVRSGRQVAASADGARKVIAAGQPAGVLAYGGGQNARQQKAARDTDVYFEGGKARALYLPIGFILIGALFYLWQALSFGNTSYAGTGLFIAIIGVRVIFDAVMTFLAMLAAAKFFDMGFGAIGPAILKLFALTLGPAAVGELVEGAAGAGAGGALLGGAVTVVLYLSVIKLLFELDLSEAFQFVGVLYVIRRWVGTFVFLVFMTMIFPSVVSPGGGSRGIAGVGSSRTSSQSLASERTDREAAGDELLAKPDHEEAKAFLDANPQRTLHNQTPAESRDVVKALYTMGAKKVTVSGTTKDGKPSDIAEHLIVELPSDSASRTTLLNWKTAAETAIGTKGAKLPLTASATPAPVEVPEDPEDVIPPQDVGERNFVISFSPDAFLDD